MFGCFLKWKSHGILSSGEISEILFGLNSNETNWNVKICCKMETPKFWSVLLMIGFSWEFQFNGSVMLQWSNLDSVYADTVFAADHYNFFQNSIVSK